MKDFKKTFPIFMGIVLFLVGVLVFLDEINVNSKIVDAIIIAFSIFIYFYLSPFWQENFKKFFKFSILGGIGVLLGYIFFLFFTYLIGLKLILSLTIGEFINYVISFFVHKYWTFGDKEKKRTTKEMSYYSLVALGYFLINTESMHLLTKECNMEEWISKALLILILALPNYWATKTVFDMGNKKMAKWMAEKILSRMKGNLFLGERRRRLIKELKNRSKILDIKNLKKAFDLEKGIIHSEITSDEIASIKRLIIFYLKKLS